MKKWEKKIAKKRESRFVHSRGTHLAWTRRRRAGGWACVAGPSPGRKHSPASPPGSFTQDAPRLAGRDTARKCHIAVSTTPPDESNKAARRQFAERRSGSDQRVGPRRTLLPAGTTDMRKRVDRRGGPERRSTLERRSHSPRNAYAESP